jgi:hypothetical protein
MEDYPHMEFEKTQEFAQPMDVYTKQYIDGIDYNDAGKAFYSLYMLGALIANQFWFCLVTEARNRLYKIQPQCYEAVEDTLIKHIISSADIYAKAVKSYAENLSADKILSDLLDINTIRASTIKTLTGGVNLYKDKNDPGEKQEVLNAVTEILTSINTLTDLFNSRLENMEGIQAHRVLKFVEKITKEEIGLTTG